MTRIHWARDAAVVVVIPSTSVSRDGCRLRDTRRGSRRKSRLQRERACLWRRIAREMRSVRLHSRQHLGIGCAKRRRFCGACGSWLAFRALRCSLCTLASAKRERWRASPLHNVTRHANEVTAAPVGDPIVRLCERCAHHFDASLRRFCALSMLSIACEMRATFSGDIASRYAANASRP